MNLPTKIRANPATTISAPVINTLYDAVEAELANIINIILDIQITEDNKDQYLYASMISSVEILMDLEERFPDKFLHHINGIHCGKSKIDDDEFEQCKTFNQMMQLIRRSI